MLLTPLADISDVYRTEGRLVQHVNENLLSEIKEIMNKYDELDRTVADLKYRKACCLLLLFKFHIDNFAAALTIHRNYLIVV